MKTKPRIVITPGLDPEGLVLSQVHTEMLLLTRPENLALGSGSMAIDRALKGLISREMDLQKFSGALGQHLLLDLRRRRNHPQRYILLAGIGSPSKFNGRSACQVFRLVVDQALEAGVGQVTIPFAPNRITDTGLNMKGTAHILHEVIEDNEPRLSSSQLDQVEVLCTPQARRHIVTGLKSKHLRQCCKNG